MQLLGLFRSQDWSVTFASAASATGHMADIEALGVARAEIELNSSSFDDFVRELNPGIVLFDRFMIEEQFGWRVAQQCPDALRLLDTEDLHCLRAARHEALKQGREVTAQDLNSELAMREVAAILRCDLSLIISKFEFDLLQRHYGVSAALLWHLPFMLPAVDEEALNGYDKRRGYISIGNFRHAPNWDAVQYLRHTLWPLIRARQADACLDIYGAYIPHKATQLHDPDQGFHVKGRATDAYEVMRRARICLAPLRFGAGLKGKLIDAMSCGTPNVTTSVGAEGMHAALPWSGIIADDEATFAGSAVRLYQTEDQWRQAQRNGVAIINTLYAQAELGAGLLEQISRLREHLARHRQGNFIGAMLHHHTLQSTRYMARWIEAKNRNARGEN